MSLCSFGVRLMSPGGFAKPWGWDGVWGWEVRYMDMIKLDGFIILSLDAMDDFKLDTIVPSRAEWCAQFIMIVKPFILEGFDEMFKNAIKLCAERRSPKEYLKTFQQFIMQIPKWSQTTIDNEAARIIARSKCSYLELLLTNVYMAQLKILSAIRVGSKSKKIDVDIPPLSPFIHKIYIVVGTEIYKKVYLYVKPDKDFHISSMEIQKNRDRLEEVIEAGILTTFRSSIPIDKLLRIYLEPTEEEDVTVKTEEQMIYDIPKEGPVPTSVAATATTANSLELGGGAVNGGDSMQMQDGTGTVDIVPIVADDLLPSVLTPPITGAKLTYNDTDMTHDSFTGEIVEVSAPKDIERLEEISALRNMQRKLDEGDAGDSDQEMDDNVTEIGIGENISLPDLYDEEL
jgi:hypothetical protein